MATRSIVAIPAGDGWMGRYVHWDGGPARRLPILQELVKRDGIVPVIDTIVRNNYGWSHLDPEQTYGLEGYHTDGRFLARPGYGVAYTLKQAGGEEMETDQTADPVWIEYVYILGPRTLTVMEGVTEGPQSWRLMGTYHYDDALVGA